MQRTAWKGVHAFSDPILLLEWNPMPEGPQARGAIRSASLLRQSLMLNAKAPASKREGSCPRDAPYWAAAFAAGLAGILLYHFFYASKTVPFSQDAATYISAARNFALGKGFLIPAGVKQGVDFQTIRLWPPGYPFLIYVFSFLCGTPSAAALFISRLSLALVPVAAFWLVRPYCTPGRALALSLLFWTSIGVMQSAYFSGSDVPFFLMVIVSMAAFLRGIDARDQRFLAAAGAIAGASLLIRNAGLPLLAAEAMVLVIAGLMEWRGIKPLFRFAGPWGLAAALPVCGLLVWNQVQFGTLSPYAMGPSQSGPVENAGAATGAYVYDSFPSSAGRWLASNHAIASTLLFALLVSLLLLWASVRYRRHEQLSRFMLLAVLYAVLGTIMVVTARTRYEWGEPVGLRHVAQYDSLLISATLLWLPQLRHGPGRALGAAIICVVLGIVGWRACYFVARYRNYAVIPQQNAVPFLRAARDTQNLLFYYDGLPEVHALIGRISAQCYVATNLYPLTNSTLGQNMHNLEEAKLAQVDRATLDALNARARTRPVLIVIGQTSLVRITESPWRQQLQKALPAFDRLRFDSAPLITLASSHGGCWRDAPGKS